MWLKWVYQILLDERGEDAPAAGGEGQGGAPAEGGEGTPPGAGEGEGAGEGGQGTEPPATPAFGDFGDTPKTLEEATKYNCILGLNIPSCFDEVDNHWLSLLPSMGNFDFVVGYAGGAALKGFGNANFMAQKIYEEDIKYKEFDLR